MDESLLERISLDPTVMLGKPVIRGTRVPVELIVRMIGQGIPATKILDEYPRLTSADIQAAVTYAAEVVAHEAVFPILPS